MDIAIKQFGSTLILVFLVIGWIGIALALSGLAVLIYRVIRMALR